ncbi:MAG: hypothetical protein HY231_15855 [Acidobacteria bacterium]|nr:hypothetical protein [Acidobacteriota bacterium]
MRLAKTNDYIDTTLNKQRHNRLQIYLPMAATLEALTARQWRSPTRVTSLSHFVEELARSRKKSTAVPMQPQSRDENS